MGRGAAPRGTCHLGLGQSLEELWRGVGPWRGVQQQPPAARTLGSRQHPLEQGGLAASL